MQARGEAGAFQRHLPDAVDPRRGRDPDHVQQRRGQIAGMGELVAQFSARGDPFWP